MKKQQLQQQPHHHHHPQGPSINQQHQLQKESNQQQNYLQASYQQQQPNQPGLTNSNFQANGVNNGSGLGCYPGSGATSQNPTAFASSTGKLHTMNHQNNGNLVITSPTNQQHPNITSLPSVVQQGKRVPTNRLETTMVSTSSSMVDHINVGITPTDVKMIQADDINSSGMNLINNIDLLY